MKKNVRQLAAVMFTDMVGYTALMQTDEHKAKKSRDRHRKVLEKSIQDYHGLILQYYGDGTLSVFGSAIEAIECAVEIQQELQKEPQVPLRIGMHVGDIVYSDDGIYGDAVNIASRIERLSVPGGVLVSDKIYDEIKNHPEFNATSLGEFDLKNVKHPVELFALTNKGLQFPTQIPERKKPGNIIKESQYPILETKLYIPSPRHELVQRDHLIDRLSKGIYNKLILISASAGFGKTTLISNWISKNKMPAVWISLDKSDNDPVQFFHYFIAAIQKFDTNIGQPATTMLQSTQLPPLESVMTSLIKEITNIPNDFLLVLDDYHYIDSKQVHGTIEFLLDHIPPKMHLAMTTRVDPPLPLSRFRVRNQLTEFRATDLCFSLQEATDFFNKLLNLSLSNHDISTLESRTEGWIAGLQLAALSLQGRKDIASFIKSFAGDNRHIVDYFAEEVLNIQSEPIRNFLLKTSILNRLSVALCDFVTDIKDSQKILDELERTNLFIVPLDDKRQWYRYHQLFADLLRQQLQLSQTDNISELNSRASIWFAKNGFKEEAINHALIARDFEQAADLIELSWEEMDQRFQSATWLSWAKQLPDELVRSRPVLNAGYAWALLDSGNMESAEARLLETENLLEATPDFNEQSKTSYTKMIYADEEQFRALPATIATARAYLALSLGDISAAKKHSKQALKLMPETDYLRRGAGTSILGIVYWATGELETTYRYLVDAMNSFRLAGNMQFGISVSIAFVDLRIAQGLLCEAKRTCDQAIKQTEEQQGHVLAAANLYLELSVINCEQGDLKTAIKNLLASEELGEKGSLPDWSFRFYCTKSRIKETRAELDGALDLLNKAESVYYRNPMPDVRPVSALKARIWIKQGKLNKALDWVQEKNLSVNDEISYIREFEYVTFTKVLIALFTNDKVKYPIDEALDLLERLRKAAEDGKRIGSIIEIRILLALVYYEKDDLSSSIEHLKHALKLAEPEGYIQIFIDEGSHIAELLEKIIEMKTNVPRAFIKKILSTFKLRKLIKVDTGLVDDLSERELEVLRLIAAGLSNKKIVEELLVSLSTVKTHLQNIYNKLNVHSRTEAIVKAKELDLL